MSTRCGNCEATEVTLKTCGRCKSISYCSQMCQVKSWRASHKNVCRRKVHLSDQIPSEVRDKPWVHEFIVVRQFLEQKCNVDSREIRQLSEDEELLHELYSKITEHSARADLAKAMISSECSSTESALANRTRLASSFLNQNISKDGLPRSAAEALQDICSGGDLLSTPPPHLPCDIRLAIVKLANEGYKVSEEKYEINTQVNSLKNAIVAVEKKESIHIAPAIVKEKAKSYKAFQNDISDLEKKGFEYEGTVSKLTKELKHAGFDDKLTHEKIVADAEALAGKKEEVEENLGRIAAFHGLPANLSMAKVALEQKRRDLAEMKEEADRIMGRPSP